LEESPLLGADYFGLVASTEDFREGTKSFLEKGNPSFRENNFGGDLALKGDTTGHLCT
jgi:hypothetical protein